MGCIRVLACIYVILVVTNLSAQPLVNINTYLNNPGIPKAAKLFYDGKIKASDDSITFSLIDSLNTKSRSTRPFYILLVSRIIEKADGGLAEMVLPSCANFFENSPDALLEFLYSDNKFTKGFKFEWASAIAGGVELGKNEDVRQYIDKAKGSVFKKTKQKNLENLKDFYTILYKQL